MNRKTSGLIEFGYRTSDLLDRVQMYTQYPVRMKDKSEDLMVTDDESTLVYSELDKAIDKVFQIAYKLSFGVTDSLYKNASVTWGTETFSGYGFKLNDKQGYNENLLPVIDGHIEELLTMMVVYKWFLISRQNDLAKEFLADINSLLVRYNNSLTELYKPKLQYFDTTEYADDVAIEVDEDGVITEETETESTTSDEVTEIIYYDSTADFPDTGVEELVYVAKDTATQYYWTGTAYAVYFQTATSYSQSITAQSSVSFTHNLNKTMLRVIVTDMDGVDWEWDYTATDANSGTASGNTALTGTLYAS